MCEKKKSFIENAKELASKATLEKTDFISWAAFHACRLPTTAHIPAVISLLPMFYKNAHSVVMILHAMNIIKAAVNHINPSQIPVITLDQPLFNSFMRACAMNELLRCGLLVWTVDRGPTTSFACWEALGTSVKLRTSVRISCYGGCWSMQVLCR